MSSTERLYYDLPDAIEAEARVLEVLEGGAAIVLDRTLFYPEGGGQPCDLGAIRGRPLASVTEEGGRIVHRLAEPAPFDRGERVGLSLDAARRRDHSVQHTAQHLISSVMGRLYGAGTLSFHLGAERSTVDLDLPSLSEEELLEAEARIDAIVAEGYPVITHLCPPEDPGDFPLRKRPPRGEEAIRIVEIDGLDYSPCCGTHLRSTLEIRAVRLLAAEKYKGATRLSFVAGERATADHRALSDIARRTARALACSPAELPDRAARAAERLKEAEARVAVLERARAALEAERAAAGPGGMPRRVFLRFTDRGAASAQEAVRAYAAAGAVVLAASIPDATAVAAAPGPEARLGELLGPLAAAAGGRGGGGPTSFRASFPDESALDSFVEAAESGLGP